ncbi:MAG TPA: hypothetical protein VFV34_11040, partial [Blastocatellia bacterium]|nr:hypothetical protein [Blastocatellia bacterium]
GWYSWNYTIIEDGKEVAFIESAWLREAATFFLDGFTFKVYRQGMFGGPFVLEKNGEAIIFADKPSAWESSFNVSYLNRQYTLEAQGFFRRRFLLREGERVIGSAIPDAWCSRTAIGDFPPELPMALRIFLVWLVIIMWKRQSDAAVVA